MSLSQTIEKYGAALVRTSRGFKCLVPKGLSLADTVYIKNLLAEGLDEPFELVEAEEGVGIPKSSADEPFSFTREEYSAVLEKISGGREVDAGDMARFLLYDFFSRCASDLHLLGKPRSGVVRYRINGRLQTVFELPFDRMRHLIHVLCMMGGKDHASLYHENVSCVIKMQCDSNLVEYRFQSMVAEPLPFVVLRSQTEPIRDINRIGFLPEQLELVKELAGVKSGIVIVAGATGSGKTNTLESIMAIKEQQADINIIELGDPVEIKSDYRVQVDLAKRKNDFASKEELYFRSFLDTLRADPDVLYFVELRSPRVVSVAIDAALSGHSVYTTFHAGNIQEVIARLLKMGVDSSLLAYSLEGVIAQRLVRVLCSVCRIRGGGGYFANTEGCDNCIRGIVGRTAVAEVIRLSRADKRALEEGRMPVTRYLTIEEALQRKIEAGLVPCTEKAVLAFSSDLSVDDDSVLEIG